MNCPKCQIPAVPFNLEADLFFDRCENCKGMWLDAGELSRMTGSPHDFPDPELGKDGPGKNVACPKCGKAKLHEVVFGKSKIIVETCGACRGLWLDARELVQVQKILRDHRITEKKKRLNDK